MNLSIWYHLEVAEGNSLDLYTRCIVKQFHHYKQCMQNYKDHINLWLCCPRFLLDKMIDIDLS